MFGFESKYLPWASSEVLQLIQTYPARPQRFLCFPVKAAVEDKRCASPGLGHLTLPAGLGLAFQRTPSKRGHSCAQCVCVCVSHDSKCTETISTFFFQPERAQRGQEPVAARPCLSLPQGHLHQSLQPAALSSFSGCCFHFVNHRARGLVLCQVSLFGQKLHQFDCMVFHALQREGTSENQKRSRSWTPGHLISNNFFQHKAEQRGGTPRNSVGFTGNKLLTGFAKRRAEERDAPHVSRFVFVVAVHSEQKIPLCLRPEHMQVFWSHRGFCPAKGSAGFQQEH